MDTDQIANANAELRGQPALDIVKWAVAQAHGLTRRDLYRVVKIAASEEDALEPPEDGDVT